VALKLFGGEKVEFRCVGVSEELARIGYGRVMLGA
jgi:hypothetical protein